MGGCCSTLSGRDQALTWNLHRLAELEETTEEAPWRKNGSDVKAIQTVVDELKVTHLYLLSRNAEVERVTALAAKLIEEVTLVLDKKTLLSHNTAKVQTLRSVAASLDELTEGASFTFNKTLRELQTEIAGDTIASLQLANARIKLQAPSLSKEIDEMHNLLLSTETWLIESDTATKQKLQHVMAELKSIISERLPSLIRTGVNQIPDLQRSCQRVDEIAGRILTGLDWEPVTPAVTQSMAKQRAIVLPELLGYAEAEFAAMENNNYKQVLDRIAALAEWWSAPTPELAHRFQQLSQRLEERFAQQWEEAVAEGTFSKPPIQDVREYDRLIAKMNDRKDDIKCKVLFWMEQHYREESVARLISDAQKGVDAKREALKDHHKLAKERVQALSRDKLEETRPPTWMFKLRKGAWKAFSAENSREVEYAYQKWLAAGQPSGQKERRCQIAINIQPPTTPGMNGTRSTSPQKAGQNPNPAAALQDMYSIDFMLQTQMSLSHGSNTRLRKIKREIEGTAAQQLTRAYFDEVSSYFREVVGHLEEAEADVRLLGNQSSARQADIDAVLESLTSTAHDFLELAVLVRDMKAINDFTSLIPTYAEKMGIESRIKELRLQDVMNELAQSHAAVQERRIPPKWQGLRLLFSQKLLAPRLKLHQSKIDHQRLNRRRAMMLGQALLTDFELDVNFCAKFQTQASKILEESAKRALALGQVDELCALLRGLKGFGCDSSAAALAKDAGAWMKRSISRACEEDLSTPAVLLELLQDERTISKAAQLPHEEFSQISALVPLLVGRATREATGEVKYIALVRQKLTEGSKLSDMQRKLGEKLDLQALMTQSVEEMVMVRTELGSIESAGQDFDEKFWTELHPKYEKLPMDGKEATIDWTMAYCEQLGSKVPDWMMNKDQVAAMKTLQSALESEKVEQLVQAVKISRRTQSSDPQFAKLSEDAMEKLRKLKRLPPGWEVNQIIGEDEKMFGEADLNDRVIKSKFQDLLDKTNAGILTRDRLAREGSTTVPRGYRVERVTSVMNADSWGLYLRRRDEVAKECAKFSSEVPPTSEMWSKWSGTIATTEIGAAILDSCQLPPLVKEANEFLMFHGTKPAAAQAIAHDHFDMARACKDGLFGAGLYFAESSSKSDEYVKCDDTNMFPLIVARVCLGHINYCDSVDPTVDPGREKLLAGCLSRDFHSVLGDRKKARGTYREFIVYDHYQVYPQFIVWYTRL